jgi:beta-glucanase (GH16 family)
MFASCDRPTGDVHMLRAASRVAATVVLGAALVAPLSAFGSAESKVIPRAPGIWSTVWTDSFNGRADGGVNARYWKYDVGQGIFGTGEVQTMTKSLANVHLAGDGSLAITALHRGGWTSGRIQTVSSAFAAPPGGELSVSASIRLPGAGLGPGYWPAFWLLGPGTWPEHGEIDAMEDVDSLSEHSGALHCGNLTSMNSDGTTGPCHEHSGISSGLLACPGCQSGYHVYSVTIDRRDRAEEQIRWDLDGQQFFSVNESQVGQAAWSEAVDHGFSIILDLAIGGFYPDSVCSCTAPTAQTLSGGTMSVQYVTASEWTPGLTLLHKH